MQGRWTLLVDRHGEAVVCDPDVSVFPQHGEALTSVVPCDDAAIDRGTQAVARALYEHGPFGAEREIAEAVLRAAGETP